MEFDSKAYIGEYIERARKAQAEFEKMSQEEVDLAVKTIAKVVYDNAEYLAEIAVEETGMGNVPDKIAKNKHNKNNSDTVQCGKRQSVCPASQPQLCKVNASF